MSNDEIFRLVLPKADKEALMVAAQEERTSASALVRKLILGFLKDRKK